MSDPHTTPSEDLTPYLTATRFVDADHPSVIAFAEAAAADAASEREKAVRVYLAVRDGIMYDPYSLDTVADHYKASHTLASKHGFCVSKATLLAAVARAIGLPARLGYADVRNHLATPRLLELIETDLFVYHGYVELRLGGKWVKCTPAFNLMLCERFRVLPLEFDGEHDSLFHPYDADGRRHMEYVRDHGTFADVPFDAIARVMEATYPKLLAHNARRHRHDFAREADRENRTAPAA
jgi:transglutaminase-like putative cysteine protease